MELSENNEWPFEGNYSISTAFDDDLDEDDAKAKQSRNITDLGRLKIGDIKTSTIRLPKVYRMVSVRDFKAPDLVFNFIKSDAWPRIKENIVAFLKEQMELNPEKFNILLNELPIDMSEYHNPSSSIKIKFYFKPPKYYEEDTINICMFYSNSKKWADTSDKTNRPIKKRGPKPKNRIEDDGDTSGGDDC